MKANCNRLRLFTVVAVGLLVIVPVLAEEARSPVSYQDYEPGDTDPAALRARATGVARATSVLGDKPLRKQLEQAFSDGRKAWEQRDPERVGRILSYMEAQLKEAGVEIPENATQAWLKENYDNLTWAGEEDNKLTAEEKADAWMLLFDGKTLEGWKTSDLKPSRKPVENGCLNPYNCGGYMLVHEEQWKDFVLKFDFIVSKGCNSGVFVRTYPLTPKPGLDVGFNGIEMQIMDSPAADYHSGGAIYDLVKPAKNAMKPAGEWNRAEITCYDNEIKVVLNGETVAEMDLDEWTEPYKRPDGTKHKFPTAYKDHPRRGYIGLQDHGSPCWFKNVKLLPLNR